MKKSVFVFFALFSFLATVWADTLQPSTTLPTAGKPEHLYTLVNGNGMYLNSSTSPTQTEANYALFAFYTSSVDGAYYIYNYTAGKWVNYQRAASYNNGVGFVTLAASKSNYCYWNVEPLNEYYQFSPVTSGGTPDKYLNFYGGTSNYPLDGTKTLGLWQQGGNADAGSRWTIKEVDMTEYVYTVVCDEGQSVTIAGQTYKNGDTYTSNGPLSKSTVSAPAPAGSLAIVKVDNDALTISVNILKAPQQPETVPYTNAVLYPRQQDAVGEAKAIDADGVYTLYNNVLAASYVKVGESIYFGGSKAMNLEPGTEPFFVSFGTGTEVPASMMKLKSLQLKSLDAEANAVGGAEHFAGKALVANYEYTYGTGTVKIEWKAVLRDGSHYLRTEMELIGDGDVDMYNIIPLIYNVDTKAAGSTPAVVGNTRGAVLMSNKIFAGVENPVAYNTVGDATGDEDKYDLTTKLPQKSLTAASWTQEAEDGINNRVVEATGYGYPNIYGYRIPSVELKANQKLEVTITYKSGNHRLNFAGVDLIDGAGSVAANDYHSGYSGSAAKDNTFTIIAPNDGTYTIRCLVENGTEVIDATSVVDASIYTPKEGVVINTDLVGIQGRWSRNTTLADKESWKISAVVGLVAQDGQQANTDVRKTQKRRSFLAYNERERAVPWRCFPMYNAWYELQINRNNAPNPINNSTAAQIEDVMSHWKTNFYDRFEIAPVSFVIDDGWDNYGTWTFHAGYPNELRGMAAIADEMGSGVGAWLGPVGGYGQSGNYRRAYWTNRGESMVLSNPNYYKVFLDAAKNLTQNQGNYNYFKFDGISAQFSSVGPDNGDTGNENAEGIIRLERYVRENLKRDIFFNTTVGTWASPFWYHFSDATWRQENDYGTIGDNKIDRENWITYRDRLVYQNYVTNSPICPINNLMTHGFILTRFGAVSKNMEYAPALRELRCSFACGSGMVELYNDYLLMDTINGGQLWADIADCIKWQERNADVLMDAHWVGGNPWNGSKASIYGWASWNGDKSTLCLRNGANEQQSIKLTLREAFEIPANVTGSIILTKSFADQLALSGLAEGQAIDVDQQLTLTLPGSSVYVFEGIDAAKGVVAAQDIEFSASAYETSLGKNTAVLASVLPANATNQNLSWTSSDPSVASISGGYVKVYKEGTVTITATTMDGTNVQKSVKLTVTPKEVEPYAINFDRNASATNTSRRLNKITLSVGGKTQTVTLPTNKPYQMLSEGFTIDAGATVQPSLDWTGSWMHSYVFCDRNQNKQYDVTSATDPELVSFTYYEGKNSAGVSKNNDCGVNGLPSFVAPNEEGTYMLRVKIDWNSIDPAGNMASGNDIIKNGGCIIDVPLVVEDPTGLHAHSLGATDASVVSPVYFDLQGNRLASPRKGQVYIDAQRGLVK